MQEGETEANESPRSWQAMERALAEGARLDRHPVYTTQ